MGIFRFFVTLLLVGSSGCLGSLPTPELGRVPEEGLRGTTPLLPEGILLSSQRFAALAQLESAVRIDLWGEVWLPDDTTGERLLVPLDDTAVLLSNAPDLCGRLQEALDREADVRRHWVAEEGLQPDPSLCGYHAALRDGLGGWHDHTFPPGTILLGLRPGDTSSHFSTGTFDMAPSGQEGQALVGHVERLDVPWENWLIEDGCPDRLEALPVRNPRHSTQAFFGGGNIELGWLDNELAVRFDDLALLGLTVRGNEYPLVGSGSLDSGWIQTTTCTLLQAFDPPVD